MAVTYPYQYPGASNVFIPSYDGIGSGKLVVDFAKNIKDFMLNQMVQQTTVQQTNGYWPRMDPAEIVRIAQNPAAYAWQDGQVFPSGAQETVPFYNIEFILRRYGMPYEIGYIAKDLASWDLSAQAANVIGVKLMQLRTQGFYSLVTDTTKYYSTNTFSVATATGTGGATWASGTSTNPYIRETFNYVAQQTALKSNGLVNGSDLVCLMGPDVARAISRSNEIIDYVKQTPQSWQEIQGNAPNQNKNYSIPEMLYGIKVVISDEVVNYGPRGQDNRTFFAPSNQAIFLCKPGVIKANTPATSFASVHLFTYPKEEMVLMSHDQPWNRRIQFQGSDMWDLRFVSPETSFLVTNVVTAA